MDARASGSRDRSEMSCDWFETSCDWSRKNKIKQNRTARPGILFARSDWNDENIFINKPFMYKNKILTFFLGGRKLSPIIGSADNWSADTARHTWHRTQPTTHYQNIRRDVDLYENSDFYRMGTTSKLQWFVIPVQVGAVERVPSLQLIVAEPSKVYPESQVTV